MGQVTSAERDTTVRHDFTAPTPVANIRRPASTAKKKSGQARAGRWRSWGWDLRTARDQAARFLAAASRHLREMKPSHDDIAAATIRCVKEVVKGAHVVSSPPPAEAIHEASQEEERAVQEMVTQWSQGGHGYVPAEKPGEVARLAAENANSLSIYHPDN